MSNFITELKALLRIIKFFGGVALSIVAGWFVIVSLWAIFGN
jgi:hypothetical protein